MRSSSKVHTGCADRRRVRPQGVAHGPLPYVDTPEEPNVPDIDLSRRAVVTGLGAVTPIGNDHPTFWRNLVAGVSGAGPITSLRPDRLRRAHRGRGQGLRPDDRDGPQDGPPDEPLHPPRRWPPARKRSPTPGSTSPTGRPSSAIASRSRSTPAAAAMEQVIDGDGDARTRKGPGQVSPFAIPALSGSMAACQLSMEYGLTGPGHHPGRPRARARSSASWTRCG